MTNLHDTLRPLLPANLSLEVRTRRWWQFWKPRELYVRISRTYSLTISEPDRASPERIAERAAELFA